MSVYANGRSILHKGHGKTQLAVAPDVCKTPSPAGPVPLPYPNLSPDSNLTKGAETVKIQGNPVANTDSQLSRSSGDEPGTAGGLVSSKNMGAFGWPAGSVDVNAEGKGVVRLLDSNLTNGNTYNSTGGNLGDPGYVYGNDQKCPRADCKLGHDLEKHGVPEIPAVSDLCAQLAKEVEKLSNKKLGAYGRMVGVGQCECPATYKAVSGKDMDAPDVLPGNACGAVQIPPGDAFMSNVMALNEWECAAAKILSNASGHRIIALSEKWVGKKDKNGQRYPKYLGEATAFLFPIPQLKWVQAMSQSDHVAGEPAGDETPSGGSVGSCGKCQTFLPALICEMKPCG